VASKELLMTIQYTPIADLFGLADPPDDDRCRAGVPS
jgi:hypothetical protein